jgi:hypothetical protein
MPSDAEGTPYSKFCRNQAGLDPSTSPCS